MRLFNLAFPPIEFGSNADDLYYRFSSCDRYSRICHENEVPVLLLARGAHVSTDTYFNSLAFTKYLRFTEVKNAVLSLALEGSFRIQLRCCYSSLGRKRGMDDRVLLEFNVITATQNEPVIIPFSLPVEYPKTAGFIYFDCLALSEGCKLFGGYWESKDPIPFDTHIGIGICTYKREDYVTRNIRQIKEFLLDNEQSNTHGRLGVFVVDNGQTLEGQLPEDNNIHLFYNKNYGGSGGFTRALIEIAFRANLYTHILLMDDDIVLEPQVVEKTLSFLSYRKPEFYDMHVGGAMLSVEKPYEQFEMGARFLDDSRSRRRWTVNQRNRLIDNDREEDANFNGWYYTCMPREVVRSDNLPLPVFIKGDDIEYGLRNIRHDSLLLTNGIGVWHAQYTAKYSTHLIYYVVRNKMIVRALHGSSYTANSCAEKIKSDVQSLLWRQRYDGALFTIEAMEDFLKGVDYFLNQKEDETLAELFSQITTHFYTQQELAEQGIEVDPTTIVSPKGNRSVLEKAKTRLTLNGSLLGSVMAKDEYTLVDYFKCRPYQFSGYRKAIQWDFNINAGAVTKYSPKQYSKSKRRLNSVVKNIRINWDRVCREYQQRVDEITSFDYWRNHLELDETGYLQSED